MTARARRRSRHQRGAVLVEAALIIPLLFFLIFAVIEAGGLIKAYSSTANSVRAGGRMASVQGNDTLADQAILERVAVEARGLTRGEIQYVIIWHAAGPDSSVPSGCVAAAQSMSSPNSTSVGVSDGGTDAVGACNVYIRPQAAGGAFSMAEGTAGNPPDYYFGCTGPSGAGAGHRVDCNWPAQHRETIISPRVFPPGTPAGTPRVQPDFVGITMRVEHRYLSGILGTSITFDETSINMLEPSTFQVVA